MAMENPLGKVIRLHLMQVANARNPDALNCIANAFPPKISVRIPAIALIAPIKRDLEIRRTGKRRFRICWLKRAQMRTHLLGTEITKKRTKNRKKDVTARNRIV